MLHIFHVNFDLAFDDRAVCCFGEVEKVPSMVLRLLRKMTEKSLAPPGPVVHCFATGIPYRDSG